MSNLFFCVQYDFDIPFDAFFFTYSTEKVKHDMIYMEDIRIILHSRHGMQQGYVHIDMQCEQKTCRLSESAVLSNTATWTASNQSC